VAISEHCPDVPLIDRVKIQAEVLVPLIKGMEKELGKERAHELVKSAVGDFYRDMSKRLTAERGSIGALMAHGEISSAGNAIDIELREISEEGMSVDITGCRYAQFFQQIGEPELGFLLVCSSDFPTTEAIPGVELHRTQTIMQGADFCDFRYRFLPEEVTEAPAS
jgi:hypothetical protein